MTAAIWIHEEAAVNMTMLVVLLLVDVLLAWVWWTA